MAQYARYRAPAESGQKLVSPPWSELGRTLRSSGAWREAADVQIAGSSLADFANAARREIVYRSSAYVATYHPLCSPVGDVGSRPLVLTGHQPELAHPGVWLKNFAAASLAREHGGLSLNLVIDGDKCRNTSIRVPTGTLSEPRMASIPFDSRSAEVPWEERTVVNDDTWHRFAERVREATSGLLSSRFLDEWWPTALTRWDSTARIGASLSQARHLAEIQWDQKNFELPQSQMCQTAAFRRFACHILLNLAGFVDAYNGALDEYRRVHRLRNHAQPVPNLSTTAPWLQAPFWVWSSDAPQRRAIYARGGRDEIILSDQKSFERRLPTAGGVEEAVAELERWETQGLKLRSRALVTTMFARIAVADLFIHGIGGAKYDEATDAICERFFGSAPPQFAALSGTLHLPIATQPEIGGKAPQLRQRLRELKYHPERFVVLNGDQRENAAAEALVAEKRRLVRTGKTPHNAAARHAAILAANLGLQSFVAAEVEAAEQQLDRAAERARTNRVLNSREYSFCLFPRTSLEQFLLDFPS